MISTIPSDHEFPQIAMAFNASRMREALQTWLVAARESLEIVDCDVEKIRYNPGKNCLVLYRLELFDVVEKRGFQQLISAKLCQQGRGLDEFRRAKLSPGLDTGKLGQALGYLDELEMVFWAFPNDRRMRMLPKMFDVEYLRELFIPGPGSILPPGSGTVVGIRAEVKHYVPDRSCAIHYRLEVEGEDEEFSFYSKVYRDHSGSDIFHMMRELRGQSEDLLIPKALAYDAESKALWQSALNGEHFVWERFDTPDAIAIIKQVARGVAAFQKSRLTTDKKFEHDELFLLLDECRCFVSIALPEYFEQIDSLIRQIKLKFNDVDFSCVPITPLHRDLKIGNFLLDDGKVGLLDFDTLCLGDPLSDIGTFIANLHTNAVLQGCREEQIHQVLEAFYRVYTDSVTWEVPKARLYWYIAASLMYKITRGRVRQWNKKRVRNIEQFIAVAEYYLSRI